MALPFKLALLDLSLGSFEARLKGGHTIGWQVLTGTSNESNVKSNVAKFRKGTPLQRPSSLPHMLLDLSFWGQL